MEKHWHIKGKPLSQRAEIQSQTLPGQVSQFFLFVCFFYKRTISLSWTDTKDSEPILCRKKTVWTLATAPSLPVGSSSSPQTPPAGYRPPTPSVALQSAGSRCPRGGQTPPSAAGTCWPAPGGAEWRSRERRTELRPQLLGVSTEAETLTFFNSSRVMLPICSLVQYLSSIAAWEFWGLCQLPPLK